MDYWTVLNVWLIRGLQGTKKGNQQQGGLGKRHVYGPRRVARV